MDADLDIHCGVTVGGLARDSGGWRLRFADGRADQGYDRVLLTVPTPRALPLLADDGIAPRSRHALAHRWRHAFVETPIGTPCVALAPGLVYASDACLGSGAALAIEAGAAAAERLIRGV